MSDHIGEPVFDRLWEESASPTVCFEDILESDLTVWDRRLMRGQSGCRRCDHQYGYLGRYIMANGRSQGRWVCRRCHDFGTFGSLSVRYITSLNLSVDDLPVCVDRSGESFPGEPCAVCGRTEETEQHHWAPSSIFRESQSSWWMLTVPLCKEHHDEWHARMRTHGLRWPHELAAT